MLRIFLALWLGLTPAFAWAGSMSLIGVGKPSAASPPPSLALDGNVGVAINGTPTASVNLTTTSANDVIIVLVAHGGGTVSVTSPHLTFTQRASANRFGSQFVYEFSAISASPLTSPETITFTNSAANSGMMNAFGISGANTTSPFDPNGALPGIVGTGGPGGSYASATTTNSNTFIYGIISFDSTANPLPGTSNNWLALQTLSGPPFPFSFLTEYQIVSSPQTGLLLNSSNGPATDVDASIVDAVTQ